MRLAELQQLSTTSLKELAAKEGVEPAGDKRARITWLEILAKHYGHKPSIVAQTEKYEIATGIKSRYRFRRKSLYGVWVDSNSELPKLLFRLIGLTEYLQNAIWVNPLMAFRKACAPIRQYTRPP